MEQQGNYFTCFLCFKTCFKLLFFLFCSQQNLPSLFPPIDHQELLTSMLAGFGVSGAPPGKKIEVLVLHLFLLISQIKFLFSAPVGNPEEVYAQQLAQLQDMGFYDREVTRKDQIMASLGLFQFLFWSNFRQILGP